MSHQAPIIIEPNTPTTHAVIWLHGLGADGNDFASLLPHLGLPENHSIRFIFPHANSIPVTVNGGFVMPAWYDITSADFSGRDIDDQFKKSEAYIHSLIAEQNLPYENILLAGFSQGGALAVHAGLNASQPLAGLLLLSTYIIDESSIPTAAKNTLPIFICHGRKDKVVPHDLGRNMNTHLQEKGYPTQMHSYEVEHAVSEEEIADISEFICALFIT